MKETATFLDIVFDLLVFGGIYLSLRPALHPMICVRPMEKKIAYCLILLFCLYPFFGGDYFHYQESYTRIKMGSFSHMEDIYVWFIQNCCYSYQMFRLGVWGLAISLTIQAYKRLEVDSQLAMFFFAVLYLPWFSYARVSLAMAFIFSGLSFIAKPIASRRFSSIILGGFLMLVSIVFHRTAPIGIVCALGSLFFRNPDKKTIIVMCVLFPIVVFLLTYVLNQFMSMDLGTSDFVSGRHRDDYLKSNAAGGLSMGIGPYIMVFLARAPLFVVAITYIYCAYKGYFEYFSDSVKIISSYAFLIILVAFAFCFDLGFNTYTFYYRTLTFAQIPSAVFLAQMYSDNSMPKLFKCIYYPSLLGVFYTLVYSAYCTLVN